VDTEAIWNKVPEHSLIIEVGGVTREEYENVKSCNLHLQDSYSHRNTSYGSVLDGEENKGRIFVGGLYICNEERLDIGIDFKPNVIRLERDRNMVNGFDVQWYAARMIEELDDAEMTKRSLNSYSGVYISTSRVSKELREEIAEDFINEHGAKAVPVSNQADMGRLKKRGYKPVIVSEAKRDIILESELYEEIKEEEAAERKKQRPLCDRFCDFIEQVEEKLSEEEVEELYNFLDELQQLEE